MKNKFTYFTPSVCSKGIFTDRGSKFIGYVYPISFEDEFKKILINLKSEHTGARHFCFAYRIGKLIITERTNDDGEPSGTAGKPILNQLLSAKLTEVIVIVVRYFGGTLLGTTRLIHAYKEATKAALENTIIIEKEITLKKEVTIPYPVYNDFMSLIKKHGIKTDIIKSSENETNFTIEIPLRVEKEFVDEFKKMNCNYF